MAQLFINCIRDVAKPRPVSTVRSMLHYVRVGGKAEVPGALEVREQTGKSEEFCSHWVFLEPSRFSNQFGLIPADSSANQRAIFIQV
jgi:hypothetical protein